MSYKILEKNEQKWSWKFDRVADVTYTGSMLREQPFPFLVLF